MKENYYPRAMLQEIESVSVCYSVAHRPAVAGFLGWCGSLDAVELFGSNPGIGLLLVYGEQFGLCSEEPWQQARELILLPRVKILAKLGFPATNAAVRILGKLDMSCVSLSHCRKLRRLLSHDDGALKVLGHLPTIKDSTIDLLCYGLIGPKPAAGLLQELIHTDEDSDVRLSDTIIKVKQLAKAHRVGLKPFRTLAELEHASDMLSRMEARRLHIWSSNHGQITFPEPPIPVPLHTQTAEIRLAPIQTLADLREEAQVQRTGVHRYAPYIAGGIYAAYRLLRPERATIILMHSTWFGGWVIRDICGIDNARIKRDTLWEVAAYFNHMEARTRARATDPSFLKQSFTQLNDDNAKQSFLPDIQPDPLCGLENFEEDTPYFPDVPPVPEEFPLPPVPGSVDIVPLESVSDLQQEGKEQENCVGGCSKFARRGHVYYYRVMAPERATLSLRFRGYGAWQIFQLNTRRNGIVKPRTLRAVERWLSDCQV